MAVQIASTLSHVTGEPSEKKLTAWPADSDAFAALHDLKHFAEMMFGFPQSAGRSRPTPRQYVSAPDSPAGMSNVSASRTQSRATHRSDCSSARCWPARPALRSARPDRRSVESLRAPAPGRAAPVRIRCASRSPGPSRYSTRGWARRTSRERRDPALQGDDESPAAHIRDRWPQFRRPRFPNFAARNDAGDSADELSARAARSCRARHSRAVRGEALAQEVGEQIVITEAGFRFVGGHDVQVAAVQIVEHAEESFRPVRRRTPAGEATRGSKFPAGNGADRATGDRALPRRENRRCGGCPACRFATDCYDWRGSGRARWPAGASRRPSLRCANEDWATSCFDRLKRRHWFTRRRSLLR